MLIESKWILDIAIGGNEISLTVDEARSLRDHLSLVLDGSKNEFSVLVRTDVNARLSDPSLATVPGNSVG